MVRSRSQTRRSNAEPAASSGRSNVVRVRSKYSVNCRRTRASNAPAGPRPSSSTHPGCSSGAARLRWTGKNTPFRAVSEAARTSSPTGLGKRVNVMGMGGDCLKVAARLDRGMQRAARQTPDGPTAIERAPLASGTDGARRGADDDLAGRRRDTADHLAGERIDGPTRHALQVHVDHVHGQAAARHTITGGDLLVQHDIADPDRKSTRLNS